MSQNKPANLQETLRNVIKLQAWWRGCLTRKDFVHGTRQEFEGIFTEIETLHGRNAKGVKTRFLWPNKQKICRPEFISEAPDQGKIAQGTWEVKVIQDSPPSSKSPGEKENRKRQIKEELAIQRALLKTIQEQIEQRKNYLLMQSRVSGT